MTTLQFADLVQETSTTSGTGSLTLAGAYAPGVIPAQTFGAAIGSGFSTFYRIANGSNFEIGQGTVGGSGPYTLSRDIIFASSTVTSGVPQKITLSGTSYVAAVVPAGKTPFPFVYQGAWSGGSAYPPYSLTLFGGDIFVSNVSIPAPSGSLAVSSATTATPSSASTWSFTYSTAATDRLTFLVLQIPTQAAPLGTVTSVSSPNAIWSLLSDSEINGIGYQDYGSVWVGQTGPQLHSEPITISLGGSYSGNILAFDISDLNFAGALFDPNAALPDITTGIGSSSISTSFTTSHADDVLVFIAMAADNTISAVPPSGFTLIGEAGPGGSAASSIAFYKTVVSTQSSATATLSGGYQAWISVGTALEYTGSANNVTPPEDVRWQRVTALGAMNDELYGSSTGTLITRGASKWQGVGPLTNGQLLIGSTSNIPAVATLTAGTNVTINDGAGSITINAALTGGNVGLYGQGMSVTPTSAGTGLTNWLNQGPTGGSTASVADTLVGISITAPSASGDELRCRYMAAPGTTPYSFSALIANTALSNNYSGVGIGWTDGTKLEVISIGYSSGWNMAVSRWNTTSSVSGSVGSSVSLTDGRPMWVRIRYDGTTIFFALSYDGVNYSDPLFSETASSGWLSGSYTDVLFYANGNGHNVTGSLMSWAQGT